MVRLWVFTLNVGCSSLYRVASCNFIPNKVKYSRGHDMRFTMLIAIKEWV